MIFLELFLVFAKIGAFSFGGGLAMIPLIQNEVVSRQGWLTQAQFLDTIAISQVTPGPIALNTATFCGYLVLGVPGSLAATAGVTLPSLLLCLVTAIAVGRIGKEPLYLQVLDYVKLAAIALILSAGVILWPDSVPGGRGILLFSAMLFLLHTERVNPALLVLAAGVLGILIM